jgi:transcriptional regulator with XRE-family HTH domain
MTSTPEWSGCLSGPSPRCSIDADHQWSEALHSDADKRFSQGAGAFRVDRSVSQAELARRLDRPPSWVAKNELGERRIDPIELAEIAVALGESRERFSRSLKTPCDLRSEQDEELIKADARRVRLGRSAAHEFRSSQPMTGGGPAAARVPLAIRIIHAKCHQRLRKRLSHPSGGLRPLMIRVD